MEDATKNRLTRYPLRGYLHLTLARTLQRYAAYRFGLILENHNVLVKITTLLAAAIIQNYNCPARLEVRGSSFGYLVALWLARLSLQSPAR